MSNNKQEYEWMIVKGKDDTPYCGVKGGIAYFILGQYLPCNGTIYTRYYKHKKTAENRIEYLRRRGYDTSDWKVKKIPLV